MDKPTEEEQRELLNAVIKKISAYDVISTPYEDAIIHTLLWVLGEVPTPPLSEIYNL